MKPINVENLMGHSVGISDLYYRPTENDLLQDYLRCADALIINDERSLQSRVIDLSNRARDNQFLINAKLSEKEEEIKLLRQRDLVNTDAIASLSDQLNIVMQEIELIKKQK
jgi:S-adenosylmethionine:tRNA-ribosyltransferase-isomerase (queuine synthetase)